MSDLDLEILQKLKALEVMPFYFSAAPGTIVPAFAVRSKSTVDYESSSRWPMLKQRY